MNQYYQAWIRLSKKIRTSLEMAEIRSNLFQNNSSDSYDSMKIIGKQIMSCFQCIKKFRDNFEQQLPQEVEESINFFLKDDYNVSILFE